MLPLYDNIRRRRIELGMSQQDLAEKSGYTDRSSIAKIESGKVDLTQSKIIAIAKALKIKPGQLMGWTIPEYQALWRYITIINDKICFVLPGLSDPQALSEQLQRENNSPLPFDISPDVIAAMTKGEALCFALCDANDDISDEFYKKIKSYADFLKKVEKNDYLTSYNIDEEIISRLCSLTDEEIAMVDSFVQGLLANRST